MVYNIIYGIICLFIFAWTLAYILVTNWILWGPFERMCINKFGMKPTNWNWQNRIVQWLEKERDFGRWLREEAFAPNGRYTQEEIDRMFGIKHNKND